ncbi:MAG: Uma2 family endonuclease [Cyanobacteria bacterium J06614_10]
MVQFKPSHSLRTQFSWANSAPEHLPTEHDLPDTDEQPVDNELQLLIPILLRGILELAWCDRQDWFFGANMGVYYEPKRPAVGPDGFLCLGVPHYREGKDLRLSYVLWQEQVVPVWVLEIVSQKPGKEYDEKMKLYAELGVLYYTIYNPKYQKREGHQTFEVYRLIEGEYVLQPGQPVWMPEVGLGIGVARGKEGILPPRDWLYWYDEQGRQYPTKDIAIIRERRRADLAEQKAEQERQKAEQERQKVETLRQKLRDLNIDPDTL